MLEANTDDNILKRALMRRLDNERGVNVLEIMIKAHKRHIAVGVLWQVDDKVLGKSVFDLPLKYHLNHVVNEADEIAEACKEARKKLQFTGAYLPELGAVSEIFEAKGTGRRGRWRFLDGTI
jgi:hypothetical protein